MLQTRTGESAKIQFPAISVRYSTLLAQGQYLTGTGTVPYWHRDRELNSCTASHIWLRI